MAAAHNYYLINYNLIADAIRYYTRAGYRQVEVPWLVRKEAIETTYSGENSYVTKRGILVGSSEQSFAQLIIDGVLPEGKLLTASPCFRDETEDYYHQSYFFKVELFEAIPLDKNEAYADERLWSTIHTCRDYFSRFSRSIELIRTEAGYDLYNKVIEVGSYGIRQHGPYRWIYATALAEPRFSQTIAK